MDINKTTPIDPLVKAEMDAVALRRGNILTNFAFIEGLMTDFIISHYIKDPALISAIREDIFEDEYFSFGLKFNLFKKILKKYYPDETKSFPIDKFRSLSKLRNIIAHASIKLKVDLKLKKTVSEILFSHNGETVDANQILDEYNTLKTILQPALQELAKNLGLVNTMIYNDFTSK